MIGAPTSPRFRLAHCWSFSTPTWSGREHLVEFWKALVGGQRDAGIDGSLRPANQFAIVPNTTHYSLAVDPMLPEIVERFLGTD